MRSPFPVVSWSRPLLVLSVAVIAVTSVAGEGEFPEPWLDGEPFTVEPPVLLSAAYAHPFPAGRDVLVLLQDERVALDEDGRAHSTVHQIYRVLSPDGVRNWSNLEMYYSPWFQEPPEIRARVIGPDGTARELDPSTLTDASVGSEQERVFDDRRSVSGPLPAVTVGSVIELVTEYRQTRPLFEGGVSSWINLRFYLPTRRVRAEVSAPTSLPFRHVVRGGLDDRAEVEERDGRIRVRIDLGPAEPLDPPDPHAPPDQMGTPYLAWSTGGTWQEVAARYAGILDGRMDGTDVRKLVREALRGVEGPDAKIAALVRALHERIRYTGVEFGEAGLIPVPPAETLDRGYGDCKDKSTLLIAMLRRAGFDARLALVDSGLEVDLDPDMPGLGFFDHAIVRIEDPEIWIDATDEHARPGVLAPGVEGRLALIVDPETTDLVRTPATRSEDNLLVETRDVWVAERGGARMVETTECHGLHDQGYRAGYESVDPEDLRDSLRDYAEQAFAGDLLTLDYSDPTAIDEPFRLTLEVEDAEVAFSAADGAAVAVPFRSLFETLMRYLPPPDDDGEDDARTADFLVPEPYVHRLVYRIHPAPGFVAAPLPPDRTLPIGPMTFEERFELEDDGTVVARIGLDTGKRRWSPEELAAVHDALEPVLRDDVLLLSLEHVGRKHLQSGEYGEALAEFRRLAALHPDEALHRSEIAEALLGAGLGEAARDEARRAIELEPAYADAHRTLGHVLLHDDLGRYLHAGADPEGAERAFRRARELEPDNPERRRTLASFLAADLGAIPGGRPPRMDEAIAEYRSIRDELDDHDSDGELAVTLFLAGRYDEILDLAPELPESRDRDTLWIASLAIEDGVDAAIRQAWKLESSQERRAALLNRVSWQLTVARAYAASAEIFAEAVRRDPGNTDARSRLTMLQRLTRHEDRDVEDDHPAVRLLGELSREIVTAPDPGPEFRARLSRHVRDLDAEEIRALLGAGGAVRTLREQMGSLPIRRALDIAQDFLFSLVDWKVEGDDVAGYRVRAEVRVPGVPEPGEAWVVVEDGEPLWLTSDAVMPWPLGAHALALLDDGERDAARAVLEQAAERLPLRRGDDPLDGLVFPRVHGALPDEPTDDHLRLLAATLLAGSPRSKIAIGVLEDTPDPGFDGAAALALDEARVWTLFELERWEQALVPARRLFAAHPESDTAFGAVTGALERLERWDEHRALAEARLAEDPGDVVAMRALASAALSREAWDEAGRRWQAILDTPDANAFDRNNCAWTALERDAVDERAVEIAERAVLFEDVPQPAAMHTLAAVYAEVGRYAEARQALLRQMDLRETERPASMDWYVLGRIAEGYGELDWARTYYERARNPPADADASESCARLAARRLQAMDGE